MKLKNYLFIIILVFVFFFNNTKPVCAYVYINGYLESVDLGGLKIIHDDQKYLYLKSKDDYFKLDKSLDKEYEYVTDKNLLNNLKTIEEEGFTFLRNTYEVDAIKRNDYYYIDKYKIDISGTKEAKIDGEWYDNLNHANFIQDEDNAIIEIEIDDKENYYLSYNNELTKLDIDNNFNLSHILKNKNNDMVLMGDKILFYDLKNNKIINISDNTKKYFDKEKANNILNQEDEFDYEFNFLGFNKDKLYFLKSDDIYYYSTKTKEINKLVSNVNLSDRDKQRMCYIGVNGNVYIIYAKGESIFGIKYLDKFKYFNKDRVNKNINREKIIGKFELESTNSFYVLDSYFKGNRFYIPSYKIENIKGDYVIAESLVNVGCVMNWDEANNLTCIYTDNYNDNKLFKEDEPVKINGNIYESDIDILINDRKVKSYNIGGYSLVNISDVNKEGLNLCGTVDTKEFIIKGKKEDEYKIRGRIYIEGNESAKYDIKGELTLNLLDSRGPIEPAKKIPFEIKEGSNFFEYEMNCTKEMDKCSYNILTYKIEPNEYYIDDLLDISYNSYSYDKVFDRIDYLEGEHNLKILKKNKIKGRIDLRKLNDNVKRTIRIEVYDEDYKYKDLNYESKLSYEYMYLVEGDDYLDFELNVPNINRYSIKVYIATEDEFKSDYVCYPERPSLIKSYVDDEGIININPRFKHIYNYNENDFINIKYKSEE